MVWYCVEMERKLVSFHVTDIHTPIHSALLKQALSIIRYPYILIFPKAWYQESKALSHQRALEELQAAYSYKWFLDFRDSIPVEGHQPDSQKFFPNGPSA